MALSTADDEAGTTRSGAPQGTVAAEPLEHAEALRDEARRRRRIDEVFGEVLPTTTSDERSPGQHGGFSRAHYEVSRPPHWGTKQ